jgi:hypothetical protein
VSKIGAEEGIWDKRQHVRAEWRKFYLEEIYDFYSSPNSK